jgi:hypothetical protein
MKTDGLLLITEYWLLITPGPNSVISNQYSVISIDNPA